MFDVRVRKCETLALNLFTNANQSLRRYQNTRKTHALLQTEVLSRAVDRVEVFGGVGAARAYRHL